MSNSTSYIVTIDTTIDSSTDFIGYNTLAAAKNAIAYYVKTWFTSADRPEDFLQELDSVTDTMTSWSRRLSDLDFQIVRQQG